MLLIHSYLMYKISLNLISKDIYEKNPFISLSLASSLLNAEDNGFFISAGYQIGEVAQMVKNTGELKRLSDTYENLSNLLNNFNNLNQAVTNASSPSAINNAIDNLKANTQGLVGEKTNSPAYQAVSLALNATVGLWNVIGYAIMCGNGNGTGGGPGSVVFNGQPGSGTTSITCNRYEAIGHGKSMSIQEFEKLNKAYQAIQQALKEQKGFPVLDKNGTTVTVKYTYECKQQAANINGGVNQFCNKNGNNNGVTSSSNNHKETQTFQFTNTAQNLLEQASTIMNVLNTQCPLVRSTHNENAAGNGSPWKININGNACQIFSAEFSAVTSMIKNAQEIVAQAQTLNANQQSNQNAPQDFNPYTSSDRAFAQNMLNHAQAQAKMLSLANQIKNDLDTIPKHFVSDYLAACRNGGGTLPNEGVTSNTWGAGCAYVEETITDLNNSLAHFGTQAEQIKQSELLARTILDFRGSLSNLNNTYNSITTASNTPNSPFLKNLISQSTNPNNPEGLKTVYQLNQSAYSQLLSATQELGHNPFRRIGLISSQTNNGAMNGIGVQIGYKQFFGEKKRWGARYYGFFDYNHAYIKSSFFNSASDVFTYGVGTDVLYNFINDKATKNSKISFGVFGGIALAGTSWLNSQYVNLATFNNFYSAKMNVANFQFLFNLGLRMNLARNKKKASDHAAQHGMELGVKIPTINTNYYSLLGTQLQYRRLYSVYLNYVFAY